MKHFDYEGEATSKEAQAMVKRLQNQGFDNIRCKRLSQDYYAISGDKVTALDRLNAGSSKTLAMSSMR